MPKTAMDYQKTIIYQLKCNDDNITEIYVGHTTNFLKRRQSHKQNCNNHSKLKVYITIRENGGWDNWKMLEICKYPCNDRREAEKKEEEVRMELKAKLNSYRCWTNGKCSVDGCENGIINNSLCLKHGAEKKLCSIDGCENGRKNNGVCRKHGAVKLLCSVDGCVNNRQNNGICFKHGAVKLLCSVDGCVNGMIINGFCVKHNPNKTRYTCICGTEINNDNRAIKAHNKTKKHLKYLNIKSLELETNK